MKTVIAILIILLTCGSASCVDAKAQATMQAKMQAALESRIDARMDATVAGLSNKIDSAVNQTSDQSGKINIAIGRVDGATLVIICVLAIATGWGLLHHRKQLKQLKAKIL